MPPGRQGRKGTRLDDELRQRLAELGEIAAGLDPESAEEQVVQDRLEAYREGIRFAVAFIEDEPEVGEVDEESGPPVIPAPRNE